MPVLINELIIKALVIPDGKFNTASHKGSKGHKEEDKEAIIKECIEEVMEILRSKSER